jgi:TolB-like protein/Flp pilus assembly protein TadD
MSSRQHEPAPAPPEPASGERLDSWKEIAAYLRRDERTVRRWEKSEGLPVHRHLHSKQASVYAYRAEIDAWWSNEQGRLREDSSPPAQPAPGAVNSPRPLWLAGAAAAALLLAPVFWGWRFAQPVTAPAPGRVSLIVLPFVNLSGVPNDDYLSDGFTEELITQLARMYPDQIAVLARTTSMKFKGAKIDVAGVRRELGVDYVLEGSIRRDGGQLRITAQLIRSSDQTHLWAETYAREMKDLLNLESEVSQSVARQVRLRVSPGEPLLPAPRSIHPDAYDAYLRARYHHSQATVQGLEAAIAGYRKALELEPRFALAQAGLARAYIFGVRIRPRDALEQAHAAAVKALSLDPKLPEAQLALAMTRLYWAWDWADAEVAFQRALTLDPGNADAHFYYSHYLAAVGRHDEAIAAARRAQSLDPHSTLIAHYVGRHYLMAGRFDEAVRELLKALELDPNYGWTHVFLFRAYEEMGRFSDAVVHRKKYLALIGRSPEEAAELGRRFEASGYDAVLEKWLGVSLEYFQKSGHLTSSEAAQTYARLGRKEEAFRWLDQALQDHTRDLIYLKVDPGFAPLRADSRFAAALQRMGFPAPR